ncbi:MAG: hypothetical protein AAGF92_22215 [Myxococcota bacterium]
MPRTVLVALVLAATLAAYGCRCRDSCGCRDLADPRECVDYVRPKTAIGKCSQSLPPYCCETCPDGATECADFCVGDLPEDFDPRPPPPACAPGCVSCGPAYACVMDGSFGPVSPVCVLACNSDLDCEEDELCIGWAADPIANEPGEILRPRGLCVSEISPMACDTRPDEDAPCELNQGVQDQCADSDTFFSAVDRIGAFCGPAYTHCPNGCADDRCLE